MRARRPATCRALCVAALAGALLAASSSSLPGQPGQPPPPPAAPAAAEEEAELLPVPAPDLSGADPVIREQLTSHRRTLEGAVAAAEDDGAAREELATLYGRMGQLYYLYAYDDAARAAFENARRLAPGDPHWPYYLGVLHERRGELDEAARELRSVLERRPGDVPTLLRLGEVALADHRLDDAEEHYRTALEAGAGAAARYGLGRIALERGEADTAADLLERVIEEHPDSGPVHYQLGLAYRQLRELDRAREHLARRGGEPPAFEDPLVDGLGLLAAGGAVHMDRGNRALARDRPEDAVAHYRRAVEEAPGDRRAREALASALARSGRADEALELYRELVREDDASAVAHYNLGRLLADRGDLEDAVTQLRRAVELAPDFGNAHYNLATALDRWGRTEEALEAASRAIEAQPEDRGSRLLLARLLGRAGHHDRAEDELRTLLEADADDSEALLALAAVLEARASALGQAGRYAEAAAAYDRVVELAPGDASGHFGRATALLLAGEDAEARARLEASVQAHPDDLALRHALARLLATAGDPAVRDGERALELATEVFQSYASVEHGATVAMALAELGRFDEAAAWQQRVIERARQMNREEVLPELQEHLERYRAGEPVRTPWL